MNRRSLSVLCDLRPAFDGFVGISHETRLMFSLFHELEDVEVTGLIHHPGRPLARALSRDVTDERKGKPARNIRTLSRFVASTTPRSGAWSRLLDNAETARDFFWLQLLATAGVRIPLDCFDGPQFGDFLWRTLFSASLPAADFERCRTASYASLWPPWSAMQVNGLFPWSRKYAKVGTSGYDVLVAQTPWPGRVAPQTRLVIRYHDAVPVFLPHTIKRPRLHYLLHLAALEQNAKSAAFACVSEYSRASLLQIFPGLEKRAFVVSDCIADDYFPEAPRHEAVASIITSRIDASTEPQLSPMGARTSFYDSHVAPEDFRFLLAVSTLEPRKNHLALLSAWETLRLKSKRPIALVFVGSLGWGHRAVLQAMRRWQVRGELFHLSAVPPSEMRLLYSAAEAVVCPSVSEGFDLPSVEALRCGAAVAASDIPVHREILGDAALYFDAYSTASICDTLLRLLTADGADRELREKAKMHAAKFDRSNIRRQWQQVLDYCRADMRLPADAPEGLSIRGPS